MPETGCLQYFLYIGQQLVLTIGAENPKACCAEEEDWSGRPARPGNHGFCPCQQGLQGSCPQPCTACMLPKGLGQGAFSEHRLRGVKKGHKDLPGRCAGQGTGRLPTALAFQGGSFNKCGEETGGFRFLFGRPQHLYQQLQEDERWAQLAVVGRSLRRQECCGCLPAFTWYSQQMHVQVASIAGHTDVQNAGIPS